MYYVKFSLLLLLYGAVCNAEKDSPCTTPNGKTGICISINSCPSIKQSLISLDPNAFDFARKSTCGYEDTMPLVCCSPTSPDEKDSLPQQSGAEPLGHALLPDHTLCGIQTRQNHTGEKGESTAEIDEYPWLVAIKYTKNDSNRSDFKCGGSLINKRYVLTTAECLNIDGYTVSAVRAGEWKFSSPVDCGLNTENEQICSDTVLDIEVSEAIPHPYYNKRSGNNDIALLRLKTNLNYTDFVRPICLPNSDLPAPLAGTEIETTSWGITEKGSHSDVKLKIKISMVGEIECSAKFPNYTQIHINQACAKAKEDKNRCRSDSGDPLMRTYEKLDETEEERWYLEGIVHKRFGCDGPESPNLYTRVSRYSTWILNNLR